MGESQQYGPDYVLKARDWAISLTLVVAVIVFPVAVATTFLPTVEGGLLVVLGLAASGLGTLAVFGLYLLFADRSLDYVDLPSLSLRAVGLGLGVGLALSLLQAGLTVLFLALDVGNPVGPVGQQIQERGPAFLVAVVAVNVLLVAPGEELLFRNGVQKLLYRSHATAFAILGAAVVFTIPHATNVLTEPPTAVAVGLVQVFVNGVGYGLVYTYWRRIDVPIVAHAVYNTVVFAVAYAHVFG